MILILLKKLADKDFPVIIGEVGILNDYIKKKLISLSFRTPIIYLHSFFNNFIIKIYLYIFINILEIYERKNYL